MTRIAQHYYRLNANGEAEPIPGDDPLAWSNAFDCRDKKRIIKQTHYGDVMVSTVFIGCNHNFDLTEPPAIFETMVFGGKYADECWRYSTRAEAIAGHKKACELVQGNAKTL